MRVAPDANQSMKVVHCSVATNFAHSTLGSQYTQFIFYVLCLPLFNTWTCRAGPAHAPCTGQIAPSPRGLAHMKTTWSSDPPPHRPRLPWAARAVARVGGRCCGHQRGAQACEQRPALPPQSPVLPGAAAPAPHQPPAGYCRLPHQKHILRGRCHQYLCYQKPLCCLQEIRWADTVSGPEIRMQTSSQTGNWC